MRSYLNGPGAAVARDEPSHDAARPPGGVDIGARADGDGAPEELDPTRIGRVHSRRYHGWRRHLKRGFDVVVVAAALPLVLPVIGALAAAVFVSSPGNPFFIQDRIGFAGERFRCVKFRTMHRRAEDRLYNDPDLYAAYVANDFKLPNRRDPRVFPLGRVLRRASLDELPQVFNVLTGTMSLVGPRPIVPAELSSYGEWRPAYLAVRPGMTGEWQIDGREHIHYPERAELDAEYLANWRFATDLKILARTMPAVLRHWRG